MSLSTYVLTFELTTDSDPSHLLEELQDIAEGIGCVVDTTDTQDEVHNSCSVYDKDDQESVRKTEGYVKLDKVKKAAEIVVLRDPRVKKEVRKYEKKTDYIDMQDPRVISDQLGDLANEGETQA